MGSSVAAGELSVVAYGIQFPETRAPCIGSLESWPQDTREIPRELSNWTDVVRVEDGKFMELYSFNGYI